MLCPACKIELKMADRQGIEIDYCPQCRGVWLDRGELDKIIERTTAAVASSQPSPLPSPAQRGQDYPKRRHQEDDDDSDWGQRSWSDRERQTGRPYRKKSLLGEIFDF